MAVRSARGAKADWGASAAGPWTNIPEVRNWSINPASEAKTYASSSTAGAKRRLEGVEDFTGTIGLYVDGNNRFDGGTLNIRPGVTGYFKLYEDTTDFFIAPVYIDDVTYDNDIEEGELIEGEISFSGDGVLVFPT